MSQLKKIKDIVILNKNEQKNINGAMLSPFCAGTGTGGVSSPGYSQACLGRTGKCMINGYLAACNPNGSFWFY
ncbi:hypothetical protein [Aquimarina rhabdastrellae]